MRLVLRNKDKIVNAFGEDYYELLISSIKSYQYNPDDRYEIKGTGHEFINVPSSQSKSDAMFQFAITKEMYDVIVLAYYSAIS